MRNYFLVYQLISCFLLYLQNYKEFEAEILDLQSEKYGLSFDIKKYTTSGWALGDENVIGIRAFKTDFFQSFFKIFNLGNLWNFWPKKAFNNDKSRVLPKSKLFGPFQTLFVV